MIETVSVGADPQLAANEGARLGLFKENCEDDERGGIVASIDKTLQAIGIEEKWTALKRTTVSSAKRTHLYNLWDKNT